MAMSNENRMHARDGASTAKIGGERIDVPASLLGQLTGFRKYVWTSKVGEAFALAVVGVLLAFLTVYCVDRFIDTPPVARAGLFTVSLVLWLAIPWAVHRWVWQNRRLDQLARLLRVREPAVGDQLLSVIELAEDSAEQERSRTLCAAAIRQVAEAAKDRDFRIAAPPTRLRGLGVTLGIAGVITLILWGLFPAAASNAWARFSSPWRSTPRYTFTVLEPLPATLVVPHGESIDFAISLTAASPWRPDVASVQLGLLPPIETDLSEDNYAFTLPAQIQEVACRVRCGDFSQIIRIVPKHRPRLIGASAEVRLPDYLQLPELVDFDVRGGRLAAVEGSVATVQATASTPLLSATVSGQPASVDAATITTQAIEIEADSPSISLRWKDFDNLNGQQPFELTFEAVPDAAPSILSQGLPRQDVVLDTQQINFEALASDDFGVRRIGMAWRSLGEDVLSSSVAGERVLGAGAPQQSSMQVPGTFCAADLGIEPQPIEVVLWVEDYLPGRPREVSAPHVLYVLTAAQHAAWISDQLGKWQRAALDVRDKELQLFDANKQLRQRVSESPASKELADAIRTQASLEAANGRQLAALSSTGEGLLRQAARNPEIGVDHLERWAEMLQTLNDISSNRMPSVSELLKKASQEKAGQGKGSNGKSKQTPPMAGQIKDTSTGPGAPNESDPSAEEQPVIPSVVDRESSMQKPEGSDEEQDPSNKKQKPSGAKQGLVGTTLTGPPPPPSAPEPNTPEEESMDSSLEEALIEQEELLAEFEKVADELNEVLANMEGSTLVKRLKAASREQSQVAGKIATRITALFGADSSSSSDQVLLNELSEREKESSQTISFIMDDMQAYYQRRRIPEFQTVLDDMKEVDVLDAIEKLAFDLTKESGLSIAQAEFWADNLDRWAEDLVPAAGSGGKSQGGGAADSLPPAVILEVLRILEGEVNLRESTRVAESARQTVAEDVHMAESNRLADTQSELRGRIDAVVDQIAEMPKSNARFGKDIELLSGVGMVMGEATQLLRRQETGATTIAAETEVIELLLKSQRVNPKSGGGTGTSPGGGGTGDTEESALSLLGSGLNQNEKREARDVTQATGDAGRVLPEEYRGGLDAYFSRLEEAQQ